MTAALPKKSAKQKSAKNQNWLPGVAIALLGLGSAVLLQRPQLAVLTRNADEVTPEVLQQELVQTERNLALLKQVPSLGFRNLIADWAFLQFLQYFGDDAARARTNYALSPEFFEIVLDRDPYFLDGYFFLSGSSSMYAGKPDRTVEIIERNLPRLGPKLPDRAYYIWRYKAIDELLFLGDSEAARQSFLKAAEWAATYDDAEGQSIAASSAQTAEYLKTNPDSKAAQISAWTMVLANALDEGAQAVAVQRMQALGATLEPTSDGRFRIVLPQEEAPGSVEPSESAEPSESGEPSDSAASSESAESTEPEAAEAIAPAVSNGASDGETTEAPE